MGEEAEEEVDEEAESLQKGERKVFRTRSQKTRRRKNGMSTN